MERDRAGRGVTAALPSEAGGRAVELASDRRDDTRQTAQRPHFGGRATYVPQGPVPNGQRRTIGVRSPRDVSRSPLIHLCKVGFGQSICARGVPDPCPYGGGVRGVSQVLTDTTTANAARRSCRIRVRSFASGGLAHIRQMPSPGRQVSGMAGAWHPVDLPEGYHTPSRGQSCTSPAAGCVEGCPRAGARSGCARSTGCHASPGAVWRSKPGADHLGAPVTRRDARAGTRRSPGTRRTKCQHPPSPLRVRDEEVAGSNPVTPTNERPGQRG